MSLTSDRYRPDGEACPCCVNSSELIPHLAIQRLYKDSIFNITNWTGGKYKKFCADCADTKMMMQDEGNLKWAEARKRIAWARIEEMEKPGVHFRSKAEYILSRACKVGEKERHREWLVSIGYFK